MKNGTPIMPVMIPIGTTRGSIISLAMSYAATRNEALSDLIEYFGLETLKNRDFNTLSGGEKRIVMFAGAVHQGADRISFSKYLSA